MSKPSHCSDPVSHLALSFADGSYSVFPVGTDLAHVIRQRDIDDENETNVNLLTDVLKVDVEIVEVLDAKRGIQPKSESRAVTALRTELQWHERESKALSKSGRNDADAIWRRGQHDERIEALRATLAELTESE